MTYLNRGLICIVGKKYFITVSFSNENVIKGIPDLENIYIDTNFDLIAPQITILQAFARFGVMAAITRLSLRLTGYENNENPLFNNSTLIFDGIIMIIFQK